MKTIIAGSRHITNTAVVMRAINDCGFEITEVVCGGAKGVDEIGARWASYVGVPVKHFPADWALHGKAAGPIRNQQMVDYADALVLIWDGKSKGSASVLRMAKEKGMKVYETIIPPSKPS